MENDTALQPLEESFEGLKMTTLCDHDGVAWFLAKDLATPMGVKPNAIRMQVADLSDEDKVVISIDTPGGRQKMTFVSESGAAQIIVQSRKPAAAKLRKWVCDIAMKYTRGELVAPVVAAPVAMFTKDDLLALGSSIANGILAGLAPRTPTTRRAYALTPVSARAEAELARKKWMLAPAFLTKDTGKTEHPNGVAAGLTARCLHFCEDFLPTETLYVRHLKRGKTVTYISEDVLRLVHRNNWRRGQPNPMSNDLFAAQDKTA